METLKNKMLVELVTNEKVMKRLNLPTFKKEDVDTSEILAVIQMIAMFFKPQLCKWINDLEEDIEESSNQIDDLLWPMIKPIIIEILGIDCK